MRRVFLAIAISILVVSSSAVAWDSNTRPDFSGQWELVKEKSDFGKMPQPVNMTLISEKRDGYLHSVQTIQTPQGDQVSESDWYPDGKRHNYDKPVPGYSVTHWDGNTLVSEQRSNDGQYHQTVKLSMGANGKEATETVDQRTPNGESHMRLVWRRR
jgi:hypothetical protein